MPRFSEKVTVRNVNGLHVRPSTAISLAALKFKSTSHLFKDGSSMPIDCKSSLDLISNFITHEEPLTLVCEGEDAQAAFGAVREAVEGIYDFEHVHPVK
ncbi:MAG: HPr family phosphocarrier protein [Spirochaetae bacterium HGW-Spirochaetae-6]|nr:MAG: HPr family phosphocarrier protein [Spirochaetae bacterium HGW-Spirochaetae-6]